MDEILILGKNIITIYLIWDKTAVIRLEPTYWQNIKHYRKNIHQKNPPDIKDVRGIFYIR
jgi:hypothetical protein